VIGRATGTPGRTLEIGAVGTFLALTVLTLWLSRAVLEQWIQPLSNTGIFLVALVGMLIGKPFVHEFAAADQPAGVGGSDLFGQITRYLTWIWVAVFAGMTVSSSMPPIAQALGGERGAQAAILDTKTPLSFVCYWVIPFSLLGLAMLVWRILLGRM